jgi:hypothetical protein
MSKQVSNTHTKLWIFIFADWQQLLNVSWLSMCSYNKKIKLSDAFSFSCDADVPFKKAN